MKSIFESNMNRNTGYQRIDEIFGIETFGKIKDYLGGAISDSRRVNAQRRHNSRLEQRATNWAQRAAQQRQAEMMRRNPQAFVRGNYGRKMAGLQDEFADRRIDNMEGNRDNMDAERQGHDDVENAAPQIYDGYTADEVDQFNGVPANGGAPGGGGDNPPPNPPPNPTPRTKGGGGGNRVNARDLMNLFQQFIQAQQQQNVTVTTNIGAQLQQLLGAATKETQEKASGAPAEGGNPSGEPAKGELPAAAPAGGANPPAQPEGQPAGQPAAAPAGDANPPAQPEGQPTGQPAAKPKAKRGVNPYQEGTPEFEAWKKRSDSAKKGAQTKKAKAQPAQPPAQPTPQTQSYEPSIPHGYHSIFESNLFKGGQSAIRGLTE